MIKEISLDSPAEPGILELQGWTDGMDWDRGLALTLLES